MRENRTSGSVRGALGNRRSYRESHHKEKMKKFQKILEGLKDKSPIPLLLENGYTPSTIKAEIIETFKPYFKNTF